MYVKFFACALVCVLTGIALTVGCDKTPTSNTKPLPPPEIGAEAWGSDNCLYVFNGYEWQRGGVCRKWLLPNLMADVYKSSNPYSPYYRIDYSGPDYNKIYYYDYGLESAVRRDTGETFFLVGNEWITSDEYNKRLLAQQQQERNRQAQQAQQERDRQNQMEIENKRRQLQEILDRNTRAWTIFTKPNCQSSYNGCP